MSAAADDAADPSAARDLYFQVNQTILASYDPARADALFDHLVRNST
jgi:hypothetical protein